jgi:hypothetical protein
MSCKPTTPWKTHRRRCGWDPTRLSIRGEGWSDGIAKTCEVKYLVSSYKLGRVRIECQVYAGQVCVWDLSKRERCETSATCTETTTSATCTPLCATPGSSFKLARTPLEWGICNCETWLQYIDMGHLQATKETRYIRVSATRVTCYKAWCLLWFACSTSLLSSRQLLRE